MYAPVLWYHAPHWGKRGMPSCTNCGEFITPNFVRVFGDNENKVDGCPACLAATKICDGETVGFALVMDE